MVVASAPITFEEIGMIYNVIVSFFPIGYYQEKKWEHLKIRKVKEGKKNTTSTKVSQLLFLIKKKIPGLNVLTWS